MPFAAPNVRVVKHIFLLRVHDSWARPCDDPAGRRMRAEITAISDCNVANGRQSKAERIDRRHGENAFFARYKNESAIFRAT